MKYVATPEMKRPSLESWFTPEFGGKVKLTSAEWSAIDARAAEFGKSLA